jgi:hypothetical protein
MEAKLVPKGGQRDEGREEARIVMRAHGQDPSKCGIHPEDTERLR